MHYTVVGISWADPIWTVKRVSVLRCRILRNLHCYNAETPHKQSHSRTPTHQWGVWSCSHEYEFTNAHISDKHAAIWYKKKRIIAVIPKGTSHRGNKKMYDGQYAIFRNCQMWKTENAGLTIHRNWYIIQNTGGNGTVTAKRPFEEAQIAWQTW